MSHFEHVQEVALPADVLQEQAPGSTADGGVLSGPAETPSVQTVCTPDGVVTIEGRATGCPATQVSDTVQSENLLDLMVTSRSPADTAGLCEETLATPDAAPAAHRGDDGQDDDAAGADVQPEPTVPQGTTDGPAPHGVVAVAQLGDVAQDDDSEVDALEAAMERTAQRHREEDEDDEPPFFPLRVQFNPPTPFPADALPPLLAAWAMAVAVLVRGTFAVAAMMIVSAMGLILQAHGDIELWDQRRVLSYFSLIAAGSGSKKTSCFNRIAQPIREYERSLRIAHAEAQARAAAEEKGGAPSVPEEPPMIITQSTTDAAMAKYLPNSIGFMGLFLDEAAVFLGSYALKRENFLSMIGVFSTLFDGSTVVIQRAGTAQRVIDRKRFSVMLASPMAPFIGLLGNPVVRLQGFLSRMLISAPRIERREKPSAQEKAAAKASLETYDRFVTNVLNWPLPLVVGTANELDPPLLTLSPEAEAVIEAFEDEVNSMRDALAEDDPVHDLTNKHIELAGRIAGVYSLVSSIETRVVDGASARHAVALVKYAMSESIRLVTPVAPSPHADLAERIARWMARKGLRAVSMSQLQNASLGRKHTAAEFEPAIKLLLDSGWIVEEVAPRRDGRRGGRTKRIYALTRAAMRELKFPGA